MVEPRAQVQCFAALACMEAMRWPRCCRTSRTRSTARSTCSSWGSSVSAGSSMKVPMGSALSGWNTYECGELSTMMTSARSRPRHSKFFT